MATRKIARAPNGAPLAFVQLAALHLGPECLPWPYARTNRGYGNLGYKGGWRVASNLVCELVHGPAPTPLHESRHLCGKGHDGCVSGAHLVWATHVENEADKIDHGTHNRGVQHPLAVLTEDDVMEIKRLVTSGIDRGVIAGWFDIHRNHVSRIARGDRWGHLHD